MPSEPSRPAGLLAREPLLKLLAWNWLAGATIALVLAGTVLAFDVARLRSLIVGSDDPVVPVLLLVFGFLVTMCSVTMGTAIMGLGAAPKPDDGGTRAGAEALGRLVPVAAAARARR